MSGGRIAAALKSLRAGQSAIGEASGRMRRLLATAFVLPLP